MSVTNKSSIGRDERAESELQSSIFETREIEQTVKSVSIKASERELGKKSRSKCTSALDYEDSIADRSRERDITVSINCCRIIK